MFIERVKHPILKPINGVLIDLPAPRNLRGYWNFGSLLGLCLGIQILTGLFLSIHYAPRVEIAFRSVRHIIRDVAGGRVIRNIHANGARFFFIVVYLHVGRGLYFGSFKIVEVWNRGVIMLLVLMGTAFVGYVLVWGQIRFWGATVITNLLSAIPYVGGRIVEWIWGGFAVDNATLNRFFVFHFILPFVLLGLTLIHVIFLHQRGSNNPLGLKRDLSKVPFHPYYRFKDIFGFILIIIGLRFLVLEGPNYLGDPENFLIADPLKTPIHIKPEWYFLWAYAILRSIPNKLGGVVAMFSAILVLMLIPLIWIRKVKSLSYYPLGQVCYWIWGVNLFLLTWIGGCPVERPYIELGQIFTFLFFFFILIIYLVNKRWDKMIYLKDRGGSLASN